MSSTLTGPVRILQWTSKLTRKHVKSPLGGEIFALSEMRGLMDMIREFYTALGREKLGSYGLIDCESLLSHLRTGRLRTEKFLTRHFRSILGAMGGGDLGNVAWISGTKNPAAGLTKATSDRGPLLQLLETGLYCRGVWNNCGGRHLLKNSSTLTPFGPPWLGRRLRAPSLLLVAKQ